MQAFGSRPQKQHCLGSSGAWWVRLQLCSSHGRTDRLGAVHVNSYKYGQINAPKMELFHFSLQCHTAQDTGCCGFTASSCEYMFTVYASSMRHPPLGPCTVHSGLRLTRTHSNCLLLSRRANFGSQVHCTHYDTILGDMYEIHDHVEVSSAQLLRGPRSTIGQLA